jgi:glutamyl-tRNA reductase
MERIAVVGVSLHDADVAALERVRRPHAAAAGAHVRALADALAASELVWLATCNRREVIFARESGELPGRRDLEAVADALGVARADPVRGAFALHRGRAAARHVFRVAASLDSLVVGEPQILQQVREAYGTARSLGMTGALLDPLFEAAFRIGKEVRAHTGLAERSVSVVALGVALLRGRCGDACGVRIAVIGAGRTGRLAARALTDGGLAPALIVNRGRARAEALAAEVGARAVPLDVFLAGEDRVDAIVAATSAPGYLLDAAALRALAARTPSGRRLCGVDLSVPRNLEPIPEVDLVDLEALRALAEENRGRRAAAAQLAEAIIESKLDDLADRAVERRVAGVLADALAQASEMFERELRRLAQGRLSLLPERERRAVERWARATFGRLAHVPLSAAKRLAHDVPDLCSASEEETTL